MIPAGTYADHMPVVDQIVPLIANGAAPEAARAIGRLLQRNPGPSELLELRASIDALADRHRGEDGTPEDPELDLAATLLTRVLAGAQESAPTGDAELLRPAILRLLAQGPARPSEIADRTGRTRPRVSSALSALREDGFVEHVERRHPDGRATLYDLTPRGREAITEA